MDHYAADVAAVVEHLDLRNAVHIGHSTGGGEATHYVARHGQSQGRVAKLVLIGAVPPIMVKTPANPGGLPIEVFDGLRQQLAANRAQFYLDFASGPFYGFNRPGAKRLARRHPELVAAGHDGRRQGALRRHQGLLGDRLHRGPEDRSTCRRWCMHGDDDQIVPIADSALLSAKLLKNGTLKVYERLPARHVHDARRRDQSRPARLHQGLAPRRTERSALCAARCGTNRWPVPGQSNPGEDPCPIPSLKC